uniref:Mab-21-like HhH/H2TH-like domain-containing protein n=1 Tax=Zosterops lateralis melanops TaxID=1220523 RepID=A0A8D2PKP8_ZOSLA
MGNVPMGRMRPHESGMQQQTQFLDQEMAWLLQELEQDSLEQSHGAWGTLLSWQFWALLAILIILPMLCFGLRKMRGHPDTSGQKESSSSNHMVAQEELEGNQTNVQEENNDGFEAGSGVEAKKEENNDEKREEVNGAGHDEDTAGTNEGDDDQNVHSHLESCPEKLIQWPVVNLEKGCLMISHLMDKLTHIIGLGLSDSFYPVPGYAIRVGSAFEGWSPHAEDAVYSVLVPLSPPPGHTFQLELDTAGMPQRTFRVHVELLCTCSREHLGQDVLCFLHQPEEELRRKQEPSLLHTLCMGCYLDVEKMARWFCRFVRVAWLLLPQSRHWGFKWQPSRRCCKFQLSKEQQSFTAEVIFGMWREDSEIFVGSQGTAAGAASTTWLETCAVAEAKFLGHISRQAPQDSCHCKCLQLLSHSLLGVGFSSYPLKTVLTHLLSTVPLTRWRRTDFPQCLLEILEFLPCSLQTKLLSRFVIGNQSFPLDISLPSDLRLAQPPNLFEHLASHQDAHLKAVPEYNALLHGLKQLVIHGH